MQQIPVESCLVRTRRTDSQTQLTAEERGRNVMGAMALAADCTIADRRFVLIDDVITTGSTLAACAAILEQAGARWVKAATICREL